MIVLVADVVRLMSCMAIVILMMLGVMAVRLIVMLDRPVPIHVRHHARESCSSSSHQAIVLLIVSLAVHGVVRIVLGR